MGATAPLQATHPPPLPVLTSQAFQVTAEIANFAPKTLELYSSGKERQNPLMLILLTFPPGSVQTETNAEKLGFSLFPLLCSILPFQPCCWGGNSLRQVETISFIILNLT